MDQTLVIAPDESLFTYAGIQGEEEKQHKQIGALAESLDWSEELEVHNSNDGFIQNVVSAPAPNLSIAIKYAGEDIAKAKAITALLMSPEAYVVALFAGKPVKDTELTNALENWNNYFKAIQQHQYSMGEQFSIKLLSNSALSKEQLALTQAVRCALQGSAETNELLQQFESFIVGETPESWVQVASFSLQQFYSLNNAKNEIAKRDSLLSKSNSEKEDIENALKKQREEVELSKQQTQQLQSELEKKLAETKNLQGAIAELTQQNNDISSQLAQAEGENKALVAEHCEQKSENELLVLQTQQLQEELEAVFADAENNKVTIADLEVKYSDISRKLSEADSEKQNLIQESKANAEESELLQLQIQQLQEELESIYVQYEEHKNTSADVVKKLEAKLLNSQEDAPALKKELENAMSEQELLQLQIKQLQEELEFYFTEYQKLKGESPDNKALSEFKSKIEERFPHLVLSDGVTLTGGANQKDLQRITARFTQIEHGDKHWNVFSVIVNDRKGVLDIEFHAPDKKRVYPLSKFVKTGSNKVCDFSLLSPFTDAGKRTLAELPAEDHLLLIGIIEELQTKLEQGDVQRTEATAGLDVAPWPGKLLKLSSALKQLAPKPSPKPLNFKKLSLKQNMVGATNEHLLICIENLQANGISYPAFDIKVGAKQIKDNTFTEYGSLEFRELANNQAPLATWPPQTEDKWGLKLVLDLPAQLNEEQQNAIHSLKEEDQLFIKELLTKLADRLHTIDRKKLKVNQPLENWQKLITGMVAKF